MISRQTRAVWLLQCLGLPQVCVLPLYTITQEYGKEHRVCDTKLMGMLGLAQLFIGGTLADLVGRLWALRISISLMIIGV